MRLSTRLSKYGKRLGAFARGVMPALGMAMDETIYAFSPKAGTRRKAYRKRWQMAEKLASRYWESSDDDRFRGAKWMTSNLSPDSAMEQELEKQAERAADMYRNDGYAASFVDGRVNNIVGRGIRPQARVSERKGVISEAEAETVNNQLDALHRRYSKNVTRDGCSLWEVQRQVQRSSDITGEAFVLFDHDPGEGRLLPLCMEVIDPARIQTPPEQINNPNVRLGIERGKNGRVIAYYVRTTHPGDDKKVEFKFRRIKKYHESGRIQLVHVFEQIFAGQTRGFTPMGPVLGDLKDLKDYKEAVLVGEQISACFSVFISSETNPEDLAEGSSTSLAAGGERLQDIEPGRITYLGPDQKVTIGNPNKAGGSTGEFMQYHLRGVSAGLQYPYELLTKNWSGLNYSSGRLSLIDGRISFGCRQQLLAEQFLDEYWRWFVAEVLIFAPDEIDVDLLDYDANAWLFEQVTWVSPGWPWIDPTKEVQSDALAVEANLDTLSARLAARGLDLEETLIQREKEVKLLERRGLPTSMPQMNRDQPDPEDDPNAAPMPGTPAKKKAGTPARKQVAA